MTVNGQRWDLRGAGQRTSVVQRGAAPQHYSVAGHELPIASGGRRRARSN